MKSRRIYYAIGLMSGSSLDGLDICYVEFSIDSSLTETHSDKETHERPLNVHYKIIHADCIEYTNDFRKNLKDAPTLSALELAQLHTAVGSYMGTVTADFIGKNNITLLDFICSHGQTIFHQPNAGFTTQIGCGAQIAAKTNHKVVCDIRTSDVAYGGQGAPLVPIAEQYLFPDYRIFLNLGGIANISFHQQDKIIAYDVCAANTLLNYLAQQHSLTFDKDGDMAGKGTIIRPLLEELNAIAFCRLPAPKSLGTEHVYSDWIALMEKYNAATADKLATAVEHIAMQIGKEIESKITGQIPNTSGTSILITGGGALNRFLIERIRAHTTLTVTVPDKLTIEYKEALAMAFIGLWRVLEIPNCLSSVTGARKDATGGAVYLP
ncbi:MAG: anhydro-N-acetylmuramic acid kinase [Chitinophagales bacterium]